MARIAHSTRRREGIYEQWVGTRLALTYGTLPPRSAFMKAFKEEVTDGRFDIKNNRLVGDVSMDADETWDMVIELSEGHEGEVSLAGDILGSLGFEWV